MTKVWIHGPDGAAAEAVTLAEGEAIVVGRDPEPEGVRVEGAPAVARRLVVASPLVSSNHLLVWCERGRVHARDLDSKNGTTVRLEGGAEVALAGAAEVHLMLAAHRPSTRPAPPAIGVADVGADVVAGRLRDAIAAWRAQAGVRPELRVVRAAGDGGDAVADPAGDGRFRLPLVEGLALEIADRDMERTQIRWDALKAELFPYAYEQIAAFRACRAARAGRPLAFSSPVSDRALRAVLDAARARLPLVIVGESGTGKTELAAIYGGREGLRPGRAGAAADDAPPFVTVHCAHLEPALAHSLLFGALKGSYTSAMRTIVGAVKLADRGTLFLDDVDALPLETQAKLLRFLDAGEYEPLGHGEREPLTANVRVVAGTNADLRAAVRERRFREDLYWRLHSGVVVRVPPLRERPEDLEQLLREARGPSVRDRLDAGAHDYLLRRHRWRGNFREALRFCARVAMEPAGTVIDRRRCEEILAEAALEPEAPEVAAPAPVAARGSGGGGPFDRALGEAVAWWLEAEGAPPERFDELQQFCEAYLKSGFVAHALGVAGEVARPEAFDRAARQRLGCDLSTMKRKVDDYLALRDARRRGEPAGGG
ncbi:MAG TPA: sigma 54-interacting transcriptional regulator [Kofleriaceae bacterium]|nr:sigma 54-interacting transcriptional regulator [Kofleriaceae bacterium]